MSEHPRCVALVFERSGPFSEKCGRLAKVTVRGFPMCGVHHAVEVRRGWAKPGDAAPIPKVRP